MTIQVEDRVPMPRVRVRSLCGMVDIELHPTLAEIVGPLIEAGRLWEAREVLLEVRRIIAEREEVRS